MSYQYKLHKYQEKNKLLIGGNDEEIQQHFINVFVKMYDDIRKDPQIIDINIAFALKKLVNKHTWLHIPSIDDINHDIFSSPNQFNVTKYWHPDLKPHSGISNKIVCSGCASTSKMDQRLSDTNPYLSHHVDQHLFRISNEYLYTYNLVTCSTLILIQNGYVGMMHIDSGNRYEDIIEFLETYKNAVRSFDQTLKIHGFLNGEIFDEMNKFLLFPVYDLIVRQYEAYGHTIFKNILINLPSSVNLSRIPMSLYIFAIPNGDVKGFYIDIRGSVPHYISETYSIKIYEQQLASPKVIVERLKKILDASLLILLIKHIGTSHDITEENLYDLLEYTLEGVIDDGSNAILKTTQFLISQGLNPDKILLERVE